MIPRFVNAPLKLASEEDVLEFRHPVRRPRAVLSLAVEVVEFEPFRRWYELVSERRDVDDPRIGGKHGHQV